MSGVIIDSNFRASGENYEAVYNYSQDIQGFYLVLHQHLADGNIPICYSGVNNLRVIRTSSSAVSTLSFTDLNSDVPADVIAWLTAVFNTLPWAVPVVSVVANGVNESYTVTFTESVTLQFDHSLSTLRYVFGMEDLTGTAITLSGYHLNSRPQLININIDEASDKLYYPNQSSANMIISTSDEPIKNHIVTFEDPVNQLRINLYRFNAPTVICPISLPYTIILQKLTSLTNILR